MDAVCQGGPFDGRTIEAVGTHLVVAEPKIWPSPRGIETTFHKYAYRWDGPGKLIAVYVGIRD